jgi:hypothetical protein
VSTIKIGRSRKTIALYLEKGTKQTVWENVKLIMLMIKQAASLQAINTLVQRVNIGKICE